MVLPVVLQKPLKEAQASSASTFEVPILVAGWHRPPHHACHRPAFVNHPQCPKNSGVIWHRNRWTGHACGVTRIEWRLCELVQHAIKIWL